MKFYSYNLINLKNTLTTASNVNAQYPLTNLTNPLSSKRVRSTTEDFTINFDFITSQEVNSFLFKNIGWESVDIKGNFTTDFTSPEFSTSITPDDGNLEYDFIHKEITSQSLRFWQLTFHASAGMGYCEVGKMFIGESVSLVDDDMVLGWSFSQKDYSTIRTNYVGQRYIDIVPNLQKSIKGSFKYLTLSNLRILQKLWDLHSKVHPLWLVLDETETVVNDLERNSIYGYMTKIPDEKNVRYKLYDENIEIVECL